MESAPVAKYSDLLPAITSDERRRIRSMQDVIVRHVRERALEILRGLRTKPGDRHHLLKLLKRLESDQDVRRLNMVPEQVEIAAENPANRLQNYTPPIKSRRSGNPETWSALGKV